MIPACTPLPPHGGSEAYYLENEQGASCTASCIAPVTYSGGVAPWYTRVNIFGEIATTGPGGDRDVYSFYMTYLKPYRIVLACTNGQPYELILGPCNTPQTLTAPATVYLTTEGVVTVAVSGGAGSPGSYRLSFWGDPPPTAVPTSTHTPLPTATRTHTPTRTPTPTPT